MALCPMVIAKGEKIGEIENALEEAQNYLEQGDLVKAEEYVSQVGEVCENTKGEEC